MKATIKKIVWLLFIAFAVTSCAKNDDNCDPNDEESPCYAGPSGVAPGDKLLLIEQKVNGGTEMRYEYDNQNRATLAYLSGNRNNKIKYNYSGNNMVKVEHLLDDALVTIEEYTYGSGDKPTSGALKDRDGKTRIRIEYTYSKNEVKETFFEEEDGNLADYSIYRFDDNGNSIEQIINAMGNTAPTSTITYSDFDDHPTVATHRLFHWKIGMVNNPRAMKATSAGVDWIFKYIYNEAGYPVKAEVYDRTAEELIETHEYIYKKAN